MFADLKGSTALIEGLDPEDARAIIDPALQLMMDGVHRYDGYVAQALGDGIFALFGAPIAYEDHSQRALYAALRMQAEMRRYSDKLREAGAAPLQMRVGINTGEVVVRSIRKDDLHTDYVPIGHSTNIAARMEQLANPGSILVTAQTYRLTEGYFEFKALGKTKVKGIEEPVPIYEVVGVGPLRTRLQVSARRGLSRFVGRQTELERMQYALEQAKAGHGQIVGVMGEPGLGKSRLFHEFKLTAQRGCLVLEAFSVSHDRMSPYLPIIELLRRYFQIESQDDERQRKEKVGGKVLMLDRSLEGTLPYLFALLGIEDPNSSLQQMDGQIRRQRTCEALKKLLFRESFNQPLILIFEDLHWIDTETQGFLDALCESVASAQVLLLVTYRPEYQHEWGQQTYYTQLRLAPLGEAEAEELLTFLVGHDASLKALKFLILERTEGTPFFMEEVVQELVEQGMLVRTDGGTVLRDRPLKGAPQGVPMDAPLQIPPTVQGILAARIDRLETAEKELLQQLAVIGRQFPSGLVRKVVSRSEDELYRILSSLQAKEFLYEQPAFPGVEYLFKHALTQAVAYGTVLQETRRALHERTAGAIEELYSASLEDHYGELAHHYGRSDNTHKAVTYLGLAGQQAVQRSAHEEAIGHLTRGLEFLKTLPDNPERAQQELMLRLALGAPLQATQGPAAQEVEDTYTRARELCQQAGETLHLFSALRGLWLLHHVRAELPRAHALGEQLLHMAERVKDPALMLEAHRALGSTLLWLGEFSLARLHLEQGRTLYDPQQHADLPFLHGGADPGVSCLCDEARAMWFLGYPDQALTRSREALFLAQELSDPFSHGFALVFAAGLYQLRREGQAAQECAQAGINLADEHGFSSLSSAGTIRSGWALAEQGQAAVGLALMHRGLTARQAAGAGLAQPYFLALQAEVYGKLGQSEKGLGLLIEAFTAVHNSKERRLEAELYRLKGELLLQQFKVQGSKFKVEEEVEECFQQALDVARRQEAKSFELRAATSRARLWQRQGKTAEAREVLTPVYAWFTEGFETADLKDAKVLLQALL